MKLQEKSKRRVIRTFYESANTPPKRIRVAFYVRVSKRTDDQMHSFEAQKEACELTLRQHPEYELTRIYTDPGISGTLAGKRPGFMAMVADAEAGKIDLIITKSISRWSRNTIECLTYVNELKALGTDVVFEKEGIDTREVYSVLALHIFAVLSQEESRSISENTKVGIRWSFEMGEARWCPIYGYTRGREEYEIVPGERDVIRRIFDRYEAGDSLREIADALNADGIPASRGGGWRPCRVHEILLNRKYIGELVMQRYYTKDHITHEAAKNDGTVLPIYTVPDHHAPIVSREQFDRVQKVMAMKSAARGGACQYPFGDMLRCPLCSGTLRQRSMFARGGRTRSWYCAQGCGNFAMRAKLIEGAVLEGYRGLDAGALPKDLPPERVEAALALTELKRRLPDPDRLDYLLLDKLVDRVELGRHETRADSAIRICWKFGGASVIQTDGSVDDPRQLAACARRAV